MNDKLRPYLMGAQISYSEISKITGLSEENCRHEIEYANRLLNPTGDIILYPERLPWHLLKRTEYLEGGVEYENINNMPIKSSR